ncbi:CBS domain-containing protein [Flammeovirgaceae bacterium SG7u.111]|nr:CBS domain-containing protein [Flammeovirgaceae bacterium SG7u.132]WPO34145.1 CBS domain-containing protein [Flammeovirgaceae bacterium SG7u.111]
MIASNLIDASIPVLKTTDTVAASLDMMAEFKHSHLPVVLNGKYVGVLSERSLELLDESSEIAGYAAQNPGIMVGESYHFFEVLKAAIDSNQDIASVVDDEDEFIGAINLKNSALEFARKFSVHPTGGALIVLSVRGIDYSLTEISRLVESNEAKIISCFVELDEVDQTNLFVTLQFNTFDLTRIIATFERFEYNVVAKYADEQTKDYESHRIDLLLKYLEI